MNNRHFITLIINTTFTLTIYCNFSAYNKVLLKILKLSNKKVKTNNIRITTFFHTNTNFNGTSYHNAISHNSVRKFIILKIPYQGYPF